MDSRDIDGFMTADSETCKYLHKSNGSITNTASRSADYWFCSMYRPTACKTTPIRTFRAGSWRIHSLLAYWKLPYFKCVPEHATTCHWCRLKNHNVGCPSVLYYKDYYFLSSWGWLKSCLRVLTASYPFPTVFICFTFVATIGDVSCKRVSIKCSIQQCFNPWEYSTVFQPITCRYTDMCTYVNACQLKHLTREGGEEEKK